MVQDGALITTIVNIKDFSWTYKSKITTEQHLGHTGPYKDDVYDGVSGSFTMNDDGGGGVGAASTTSGGALALIAAISDRESNRVPDTIFDITFIYNYPDAPTQLITIPNVSWGDVATRAPGRDQHNTISFNFETGYQVRTVGVG